MAGKKKFGTFAGVFTPSILTILGVIMYMRLGWVVGNAGLIGTIIIILVAHVIAVTTGLSVSSIATDKKIGAGGIYYVLSRSMGIPIGGSIGIALYVGTALSIALYLIGFAESMNSYLGFGTSINDLRITGTIALVSLAVLALISTSVALKAQFFILAAIIISLIAIFFGTSEYVPETVNLFASKDSVPMEVVFAIFFPAVTGFTAGIAMSGDLKDPKKSIPVGTLAAIGVGLVVYIGLAVFISMTIDAETLKSDYNVLMNVALFSPVLVVAGIWGATLSSALGGILGGPRILQAMSLDKVTPKIFGKGKGKNNEPVNALFLVFIIAEAGILIGELDVIARIVSMFYLTAYGFINISYFLESWANPDFQPTFKIKRWIGLLGFLACFAIMFQLDPLAMFGAFAVVGGLYFWLQRKQIQLQSNDVWQSVWSNVVNKGLKRLDSKENVNANWNPNILLFTGDSPHRQKLQEFSKTLSGRTGIVTDFNLITTNGSDTLSKNQQSIKDDTLERLGIFGRKVEVHDPYSGIENIASTYGFTGIEPNTVMMNWSRTSNNPERYAQMTQKLIQLDYNLLYLDYDDKTHFGNCETIDVWWRETDSNNAEMMLNIVRYISQSPGWSNVRIRILFVNHNNADSTLISSKIAKLTNKLRLEAEIKIINNGVEQKSYYEIIELQSGKTDLTILGIPNVKIEKQSEYILNTDNLFETIGTTLLVKASDEFNLLDLEFIQKESFVSKKTKEIKELVSSENEEIYEAVKKYDEHLRASVQILNEPVFKTLSSKYYEFINEFKREFDKTTKTLSDEQSVNRIARELQAYLNQLITSSEFFRKEQLPEIKELFKLGMTSFMIERRKFLYDADRKIKYTSKEEKSLGKKKKIHWQKTISLCSLVRIQPNTESTLKSFGVKNFILLNKFTEGFKDECNLFIETINNSSEDHSQAFEKFIATIEDLFTSITEETQLLEGHFTQLMNSYQREVCNEMIENISSPEYFKNLQKRRKILSKKQLNLTESNISSYPIDWCRNQTLAHGQLQSDFNLTSAGLSVFMVNKLIQSRINRLIISPQQNEIKLFLESIEFIIENFNDHDLENYSNKTIDKLIEVIPHFDFDEILRNEEDRVLSISGKSPNQVMLVSAKSFNNLENCQNEDVEEVEVSLANIQNYIIRTAYLNPLRKSLFHLEEVFKKNAEELYNSSNLVKYILGESIEENKVEFKNTLNQIKNRTITCQAEINKEDESFKYDLGIHIHKTFSDLNIRAVIESLDSYSKLSIKPVIKSKFKSWYDRQKRSVRKRYNKVYEFVVQRKQDVDDIKFIEKHNQYLNNIERTNNFISSLSISESVDSKLSFYYKKLFTGSHLGTVNAAFKGAELNAASEFFQRIDSGTGGACMVLGESLTGKSYFLESISNTLVKAEKVYLFPPAKQNFDVNDVHTAFQDIFNKSGTAENILNQLENKTILVFDDIEKWWLKAHNGSAAINYLSKLIEKFGNKHYFVLASNIFAFDIIRKTCHLEKQLLSTIIIPPARKQEIKEILLNRHQTAGGELWYNNQLISSPKKTDTFFNDIHSKSNGNIGIALSLWISNISLEDGKQLIISKPESINFPLISSPNWKTILYHLVIHKSLSKEQINRIFSDNKWVYSTLDELEKTSLVCKKSNSIYVLSSTAKPYVELWLKDLKILE